MIVSLQNDKCFTASDVLQDQELSTQKCFSSLSVGQVCSAIVDRLSRGESICDTEVVDDVSCVDDVVEQLFHTLADESGKLTLTQLQLLIDQLPDDDHKVVRRAEDNHLDDHDEDGHNHDDDEDGHDHDEDGHDHDEDGHDHDEDGRDHDEDGHDHENDDHNHDDLHNEDDNHENHDSHDHDAVMNVRIYVLCSYLLLKANHKHLFLHALKHVQMFHGVKGSSSPLLM